MQAPEANPENEVPGVTLAVTGLVYQAPVGEDPTSGAGRVTEVMVGLEVSTWNVYCLLSHVTGVPGVQTVPHRVLLDTVQMGEFGWDYAAVVETPPQAITREEILSLRNAELAATDSMMVPDRPLSEEQRQGWRVYRQALRDLGSIHEALDIIEAWPKRPDESDAIPIALLRAAAR